MATPENEELNELYEERVKIEQQYQSVVSKLTFGYKKVIDEQQSLAEHAKTLRIAQRSIASAMMAEIAQLKQYTNGEGRQKPLRARTIAALQQEQIRQERAYTEQLKRAIGVIEDRVEAEEEAIRINKKFDDAKLAESKRKYLQILDRSGRELERSLGIGPVLSTVGRAVGDFKEMQSAGQKTALAFTVVAEIASDLQNTLDVTQRKIGTTRGTAFEQMVGAQTEAIKSIVRPGAKVSSEEITDATVAFTREFGTILSPEAARGIAQEAKAIGVTADIFVKARRQFLTVGEVSKTQALYTSAFVNAGLKRSSAFQFAAQNANLVAVAGEKYATSLGRAAASAARIGVSLQKTTSYFDGILDNFEGSLEQAAELRAMGVDIEFNEMARIAATGTPEEQQEALVDLFKRNRSLLENLQRQGLIRRQIQTSFPQFDFDEIIRMARGEPAVRPKEETVQEKSEKELQNTLVKSADTATALASYIMSFFNGIAINTALVRQNTISTLQNTAAVLKFRLTNGFGTTILQDPTKRPTQRTPRGAGSKPMGSIPLPMGSGVGLAIGTILAGLAIPYVANKVFGGESEQQLDDFTLLPNNPTDPPVSRVGKASRITDVGRGTHKLETAETTDVSERMKSYPIKNRETLSEGVARLLGKNTSPANNIRLQEVEPGTGYYDYFDEKTGVTTRIQYEDSRDKDNPLRSAILGRPLQREISIRPEQLENVLAGQYSIADIRDGKLSTRFSKVAQPVINYDFKYPTDEMSNARTTLSPLPPLPSILPDTLTTSPRRARQSRRPLPITPVKEAPYTPRYSVPKIPFANEMGRGGHRYINPRLNDFVLLPQMNDGVSLPQNPQRRSGQQPQPNNPYTLPVHKTVGPDFLERVGNEMTSTRMGIRRNLNDIRQNNPDAELLNKTIDTYQKFDAKVLGKITPRSAQVAQNIYEQNLINFRPRPLMNTLSQISGGGMPNIPKSPVANRINIYQPGKGFREIGVGFYTPFGDKMQINERTGSKEEENTAIHEFMHRRSFRTRAGFAETMLNPVFQNPGLGDYSELNRFEGYGVAGERAFKFLEATKNTPVSGPLARADNVEMFKNQILREKPAVQQIIFDLLQEEAFKDHQLSTIRGAILRDMVSQRQIPLETVTATNTPGVIALRNQLRSLIKGKPTPVKDIALPPVAGNLTTPRNKRLEQRDIKVPDVELNNLQEKLNRLFGALNNVKINMDGDAVGKVLFNTSRTIQQNITSATR